MCKIWDNIAFEIPDKLVEGKCGIALTSNIRLRACVVRADPPGCHEEETDQKHRDRCGHQQLDERESGRKAESPQTGPGMHKKMDGGPHLDMAMVD